MNEYSINFLYKKNPKTLVFGFLLFTLIDLRAQGLVPLNDMRDSGLSSLKVTPRIFISETWTNNLSLKNSGETSGFISEISPGFRMDSSAGHIKGYVDYSLHNYIYSSGADDSSANTLSSMISIEAADNFLFLDISAFVSKRTISAFGSQSIDNGRDDNNKSEVSSLNLSPYIKGRMYGKYKYEARYEFSNLRAKDNSDANSEQKTSFFKVEGDEFFGKFRWSVDYSDKKVERNNKETIQVESLKGLLSYSINRQLSFFTTLGRESQNYSSNQKERSATSGAGMNWLLSEATKFSSSFEKKPLGTMHKLSLDHRTPRTNWTFNDSRSISLFNQNGLNTGPGSLYSVLYDQFSVIEPDPLKRAQMVRDFLQSNTIFSNNSAVNGYLTSSTSIQRSQDLSIALLGLRDTITFTATRSSGKRIAGSFSGVDDFSDSNEVQQNGLIVSYSHKLTPNSSINTQIAVQKTYGDTLLQESKLKSINVNFSSKIAAKTFITLSTRRSVSVSNVAPYKETAVVGSLTLQF